MAQVGCLSDPTTMAYCYIEAVYGPMTTDMFVYQLPLGIKLPRPVKASCSACTKTIMGMYANVLQTNGSSGETNGLTTTYNDAAGLLDGACGQAYATQLSSNGMIGVRNVRLLRVLLVMMVALAMELVVEL
jgi:hypothetical protein